MMCVVNGSIVIHRRGRLIALQAVNNQTYYTALCVFGARPSVAAAAAAQLITVDLRKTKPL